MEAEAGLSRHVALEFCRKLLGRQASLSYLPDCLTYCRRTDHQVSGWLTPRTQVPQYWLCHNFHLCFAWPSQRSYATCMARSDEAVGLAAHLTLTPLHSTAMMLAASSSQINHMYYTLTGCLHRTVPIMLPSPVMPILIEYMWSSSCAPMHRCISLLLLTHSSGFHLQRMCLHKYVLERGMHPQGKKPQSCSPAVHCLQVRT